MFKLFEPNKIFLINSRITKYILFLFIIVLSIGLVEALFLSPEDYIQSHSVRIMYVHVPSAWTSIGIFSFIAILSVVSFIFKNKNFSIIAKSLAPSGFVFNIIALVTGSIWGKPTWGTWWAWDARITSMLILLLLFIEWFLRKKFIEHYENFKSEYIVALWEIPFTNFAKYVNLIPWLITQGPTCFEIDTQDDYEQALSNFLENRDKY